MAHPRLIPIFALLAAAGCAESPATPTAPPSPSPVPTALIGAWKGMIDVTACTGSGCSLAPQAFVMRLDDAGRGVIQIDNQVFSSAPPMVVDVSLQPGATPVVATAEGATPLSARVVLTEYGDSLQGLVNYTTTRNGAAVVRQGRILYAGRDQSAFGGRFEGQWLGFATRTQCEGSCAEDPLVGTGSGGSIRWQVSQAGGAVQGMLNAFAFTGTVAGTRSSASVRYSIAPSPCVAGWGGEERVCVLEATLEATVDALDRLSGTITYRAEGRTWRNEPYALTATASLSAVARWTH